MELILVVPFVAIAVFITMFLGGGKGERNWFAGCALVIFIVMSLLLTLLTAL